MSAQQPSSSQEQSYSIQPHPAKSNDPSDLTGNPQSDLSLQAGLGALNVPGPNIPSVDILTQVEKPKTRDELRARAAELNSGK
ncbi:hypothetical protein F5148DRAFT_158246 [Russula earlei]|uniref:Uncharacterized protein n=1 Tax=Russula earlei TaxID=71964 RepID=A0ACC0UJW5_9AGAM|nr:hypothetical protein F5148DRAFT_158246 [Russula earlei]